MVELNKCEVAVYILTHNRPDTIMRAIKSVISQSFKSFKIIVSDNSDNFDTYNLISKIQYSNLEYHHREINECKSAIGHLNYIIKNNTYEYFMMFHDDDEMLPNMVEFLYSKLCSNDNLVAVACNAYLSFNNIKSKKTFRKSKESILCDSANDIIELYSTSDICPFPSYMYRKSKMSDICLNYRHGGKYCDVSFIADLTKVGQIELYPDCEMVYHISKTQDSQSHDFLQYITLINYLNLEYNAKSNLRELRVYNIYNNLKDIQLKTGSVPLNKLALRILGKYSFFNFFLKYFIRLIGVYKK